MVTYGGRPETERVPVEVVARIGADGHVTPARVLWPDGRRFVFSAARFVPPSEYHGPYSSVIAGQNSYSRFSPMLLMTRWYQKKESFLLRERSPVPSSYLST